MNKPVIILSQPKSGTYLCSEIVKNLGIEQSYMHLSESDYTQYQADKIIEGRTNPSKFRVAMHLEESSRLVKPGHFAVGHLTYTQYTTTCLKDFTKIVLTRDESERKKSWENFFNGKIRPQRTFGGDLGHHGGRSKGLAVSRWLYVPGVFHLDFDHMIKKHVPAIDALQEYLLGGIKYDSMEVLEKSLAAETITKSDRRRS